MSMVLGIGIMKLFRKLLFVFFISSGFLQFFYCYFSNYVTLKYFTSVSVKL